jgi:hypothetical protein
MKSSIYRGPYGFTKSYLCMPSFLYLFGLFWTKTVLQSICIKLTNMQGWLKMEKVEVATIGMIWMKKNCGRFLLSLCIWA